MTATAAPESITVARANAPHVAVIGAGLAGLVTALRLRRAGARVTLVTKGVGGLQLGQGTIDLLGYDPERVTNPAKGIEAFAAKHPEHPYAKIGVEAVRSGVELLSEILGEKLVNGSADENVLVPTAVGAARPTAFIPESMKAGVLHGDAKMVIIGVAQYKDFHPSLIAQNLSRTVLPDGGKPQVRAVMVDFEARPGEYDATGLNLARRLDDPEVRKIFLEGLKAFVNPGEVVGLPAILGIDNHDEVLADARAILGTDVFEIASLPPCVPGMRMNNRLVKLAKDERVDYMLGTKVVGATAGSDGKLESITLHTTGHERELKADAFVLAAGGFESGALQLDSHYELHDTILGLPVKMPEGVKTEDLTHGDYWGDPQPLFLSGVDVDEDMRAIHDGKPVYTNVFAAGGVIAGATRWQEKSGEGIALGSAIKAADAVAAQLGVTAAERN
ncbi:MAG: glycerol-3-phosphate dehydrogenase subunit GlpB [Cutibacterium granulosum]|uniref:glycerol-3-phosphate dehydrogenase subunit GlpB n=1 Tax=Cutibacterium granulosum TaxID=33011 RepID=UPI002B22668E|nr:glycerol-3-phosphate dehydrogenase subunit GlpB [Cutibacterium granulosum]MEA5657882.1 glycerol-3-phosphate dehydrogenase subunit GlpB [Cutibacterium granulosum]MEA5660021.1 glycerol-3-phosphate dehydrogenase subunit GlpB [Cutibacterium granulosum]MEA5661683.1 glycerol-3-phosphate dehydrogenase subunit GlpB [Cutibacterium granulosum]